MLSGMTVLALARGLAVGAAGGPGGGLAAGCGDGAAAVFTGIGAGAEQAALDGVLAFGAHGPKALVIVLVNDLEVSL